MSDDLWYDLYEDSDYSEDYAVEDEPWEEEEFEPVLLHQILHTCALPTVKDILFPLGKLFLCCCVVRFCISLGFLHKNVLHLVSIACGVWLTYNFFGKEIIYLIVFSFAIYTVILGVNFTSNLGIKLVSKLSRGCLIASLTAIFILMCELLIVDDASWHTIRGSQMILSMKVISMAFDMDSKLISQMPSFINYLSYCFSPSSVIFGPWTTYNEHIKVMSRTSVDSLWWILRFLFNFLVSLFFLTTSTCWASWLFNGGYFSSSQWISAYRDALAFRSSHYFVCFVSEASSTIAGYSSNLKVAKPHVVEVPRSLVNIVSNWNIPMHCWLKTYIFKISRPYGTFVAILATYAASSLLHGLNFQLSSVLLSLGFYTFIEYALRCKLANTFDACILARKCKMDCGHFYKEYHPGVIFTNFIFSALTLFHLTYLGFMFDGNPELEEKGYNMSHTLSKWGEFDYVSHWIMFATFIFYALI